MVWKTCVCVKDEKNAFFQSLVRFFILSTPFVMYQIEVHQELFHMVKADFRYDLNLFYDLNYRI